MKKSGNLKRIAPMTKMLNGKRVSVCDYEGKCKNKAYREVYPSSLVEKYKDKGWSYLCKKHFKQEQKRFKNKLSYCTA